MLRGGGGGFCIRAEIYLAGGTVAIKSLITVRYSTMVYKYFHKKTEAEPTSEVPCFKVP